MGVLSKMMRIAGRGEDGTAKAIQTTDEGAIKTEVTGSKIDKIIELLDKDQKGVYGLYWDIESDTFTRLAEAEGKTAGSDFDNAYPFGNMRRCNVDNSGRVTAYYGEPDFEYDGSNGQVMVEIPKFYYRGYSQDGGIAFFVSSEKRAGFEVHPAFKRAGKEINRVYFSAFEGSVFDVSESDYLLDDEQTVDFNNDLLSSISGAQPLSGDSQSANIVNCRTIAENRGEGWGVQDFVTSSALQMLMSIEYGGLNMQDLLSVGITNLNSASGNNSQNTGHTEELGNNSGEVSIEPENGASGASETFPFSYRGVENFYGNIWTWVEGLNVRDREAFVADSGYESNKFEDNYESVGFMPTTNGYIRDFIYFDGFSYGFLPRDSDGSSSAGPGSFYFQSSGNRVARLGGNWSDGSPAGTFSWRVTDSASRATRSAGARLLFVPNN